MFDTSQFKLKFTIITDISTCVDKIHDTSKSFLHYSNNLFSVIKRFVCIEYIRSKKYSKKCFSFVSVYHFLCETNIKVNSVLDTKQIASLH